MEQYKCLECENIFKIKTTDEMIDQVAFCPFCGEESVVKNNEEFE